MGKIAFVFAGQGAQTPGMGLSLYQQFPEARAVFELADRIRPGTSAQCFSGTPEELAQTHHTQPCVFCVDLAAADVLTAQGIFPALVAGFSLGEVAALTYAQTFSREEGLQFVCERGAAMQRASEKAPGAMAAVLKLSAQTVVDLCKTLPHLYPVNFNAPGQTVVAGPKEQMPALQQAVKQAGGKAVLLAVGGAFHSPYMEGAAAELTAYLAAAPVSAPALPVYANQTAAPYPADAEGIRKALARQVTHPVQWQRTIERMKEQGVTTFIEVGPGKVLSGLIAKIDPKAKHFHVEDAQSLEQTVTEWQQKEKE